MLTLLAYLFPSPEPARTVVDLHRADGFRRRNQLVETTTGSGWADPPR
ncbi:hypothetical protein ACF05W_36425 [Streptomyces lydicus]